MVSLTCLCHKCTLMAVHVAARPLHPSTGQCLGPALDGNTIQRWYYQNWYHLSRSEFSPCGNIDSTSCSSSCDHFSSNYHKQVKNFMAVLIQKYLEANSTMDFSEIGFFSVLVHRLFCVQLVLVNFVTVNASIIGMVKGNTKPLWVLQ